MPDVLNSRDIDALLVAVDRGAVDLAAEPADDQLAVAVYDFRRPERVSKDHLRALEGLHEGFARTLGGSLSTFMRAIVDVRIASVEQCTYGEFILMLPNPTCVYLLGVEPIESHMILELGPSIVFPMLDRLLGGGREPPVVPDRPVTEIEERLVGRVVDRALKALTECWSAVGKIDLSILQMETNPPMVQALPAGEVVVLVMVETALGEASGMMHLCIPFAVVEPLMERLAQARQLDRHHHAPVRQNAGRVARALDHAPVRVTAYLAETAITLGDLMNLRIDDIIKTEKPAEATLLVTVQGKPKFRGRPAQLRGKKAVLITDRASPRDLI